MASAAVAPHDDRDRGANRKKKDITLSVSSMISIWRWYIYYRGCMRMFLDDPRAQFFASKKIRSRQEMHAQYDHVLVIRKLERLDWTRNKRLRTECAKIAKSLNEKWTHALKAGRVWIVTWIEKDTVPTSTITTLKVSFMFALVSRHMAVARRAQE